MTKQIDPALLPVLTEYERRSQRVTAIIRLVLAPFVLVLTAFFAPEAVVRSGYVIFVNFAYWAIALFSLILARPRFFRAIWAPVFIVLDVLFYEFILVAGLIVFDLPMLAWGMLPTSMMIFFFIALAGMRFTPWALIAGFIAFTIADTVVLVCIHLNIWPIPLFDPHPLFSIPANVLRVAVVTVVAVVTGMTSYRARQTLIQALSESRERERTMRLVGHVVPAAVAEQMVESGGVLPPMSRTATVLYTDIQGFTTIAETLPAQSVMAMLDAYFTAVEKAINDEGGVVTQFQGDAVLAIFNVPLEQSDHADRAVRAAIQIVKNTQKCVFEGQTLKTRVGLNTGTVVAGTVNGVERVGYTVHGDAVNLAARLEGMNKEHETWILLSGDTYAALHDKEAIRYLGAKAIRGHAAAVDLYTVNWDGLDEKQTLNETER